MVNISLVVVPMTTLPFKKTFAPKVEVPETENIPSMDWLPWIWEFPTARFAVKRLVVVAFTRKVLVAKRVVVVAFVKRASAAT
jgi:hypothetical protein